MRELTLMVEKEAEKQQIHNNTSTLSMTGLCTILILSTIVCK